MQSKKASNSNSSFLQKGICLLSMSVCAYSVPLQAQTNPPTFIHPESLPQRADRKDFGVYISSHIETSYAKFEVSSGHPLPDTCYQHQSNGQFVLDGNGKRILDLGEGHAVLWADEAHGLYSVRCEHHLDGSMDVYSAVESFSEQDWVGRSYFTANDSGFTNPTYLWHATGPSIQGDATAGIPIDNFYMDMVLQLTGVTSGGIQPRILLSSDMENDCVNFPKTSSFSVSVAGTTGPSIISKPYNVHWNLAEENWQSNGTPWTVHQPFPCIPGTAVPSNGAVNNSSGIVAEFHWDDYSYFDHALSEGFDKAMQVAADMPNKSIWVTFLAAVGVAKTQWLSAPSYESFTVDWDKAWDDACTDPSRGSTFPLNDGPSAVELQIAKTDPAFEKTLKDKYRLINPQIVIDYILVPKKADHYGPNGYLDTFGRVARKYAGTMHTAGDFILNTDS